MERVNSYVLFLIGENQDSANVFIHVFKSSDRVFLFCGPQLNEQMLATILGGNALFSVDVKPFCDEGHYVVVFNKSVVQADENFVLRLEERLVNDFKFSVVKP